ncbi:hypothetical protein [Pseudomonas aeruginosa]|nr:hypothetical protein [Pseudomonas aeruginosa]
MKQALIGTVISLLLSACLYFGQGRFTGSRSMWRRPRTFSAGC